MIVRIRGIEGILQEMKREEYPDSTIKYQTYKVELLDYDNKAAHKFCGVCGNEIEIIDIWNNGEKNGR